MSANTPQPRIDDFDDLLTPEQAAERLHVPHKTVRWWLKNRRANGLTRHGAVIALGRRLMFDKRGLLAWISERREQPHPWDQPDP